MIKYILLIIFINDAFSQVDINRLTDRVDLDGTSRKYLLNEIEPYNGEVFYRYNNGEYEFKGRMLDGLQDGHWIWNYENGQREQEGIFKDYSQDGLWQWWYPNAQIK